MYSAEPIPMLLARAHRRKARTLSTRERRRRLAVRWIGGTAAGAVLLAVAVLPAAWAGVTYIGAIIGATIYLAWPR